MLVISFVKDSERPLANLIDKIIETKGLIEPTLTAPQKLNHAGESDF